MNRHIDFHCPKRNFENEQLSQITKGDSSSKSAGVKTEPADINGDALPISKNPQLEQRLGRLQTFLEKWEAEACQLRTPHCNVPLKVMNYLINNPTVWKKIEPGGDASTLFETKPTFNDFVADLHAHNSRPPSPMDFSPQRQVEDSAIQTEIRLYATG